MNQFPRSLCVALTLCLINSTILYAQPAPPLNEETDARIIAELQKEIDAGRISGGVTAVVRVSNSGVMVRQTAVGEADVTTQRPMKTDSLFAVASMTKPITATALMMLVDEGKVALDDPVSKYVPQFAKIKLTSGESPRAVTVFDVITHTSGLHGEQKVEGSLAEHMDVLVERGLAFEPGTKWQYSPGLNVCGRIIEVVSGKLYHVFLQERVFDPLGMTETTFFPTKKQQARLAVLYQPGEKEGTLAVGESWLTDFSKDRVANPSGGLISTAENMGRFYQMILAGGVWNGERLVSEESVKQMTTIQTGELATGFTPGNGWGLGWCVVREPQGITESLHEGTYGHGGAFGTQGWVDPVTKTIYVLMIQRTKFGNSDGSELRKRFHDAVAE